MRQFLRDSTGICAVWASGDEGETDLEFGVIEQIWAALPPYVAGARRVPARTDSLAVGTALLGAIDTIEQQTPLVLVIDDLHWADSASARALLFVLRRLQRDEVLVVVAARPHSLGRFGESWDQMLAVGMAVAVLIDVSIIRMILVPAVMALLGKWAWRMPRWLDRITPHIDIEGTGTEASTPTTPPAPEKEPSTPVTSGG